MILTLIILEVDYRLRRMYYVFSNVLDFYDKLILISLGHSVDSMTVFTGDHDRTREDGEVSHEVCSKREHPEYKSEYSWDKDIAILRLCEPLIFTKGFPRLKLVGSLNTMCC